MAGTVANSCPSRHPIALLDSFGGATGDWLGFHLGSPRPAMVRALSRALANAGNKEYWETVRAAWFDSPFTFAARDEWLELFRSPRADRHYLMDEDGREVFSALPDNVRLFRGLPIADRNASLLPRAARGLSWTANINHANRFATWFGGEGGAIVTGMFSRASVLGVFAGLNGTQIVQEIVADARHVKLNTVGVSGQLE